MMQCRYEGKTMLGKTSEEAHKYRDWMAQFKFDNKSIRYVHRHLSSNRFSAWRDSVGLAI